MWLILVEALAAGLLLVFIVWWTMFSGRRSGERVTDQAADPEGSAPADPAAAPPPPRQDG